MYHIPKRQRRRHLFQGTSDASMKIVGEGESTEEGGEPEKSEERRKALFPSHTPTFEEPETLLIIMLISFRTDYLQFTFLGFDVTGSKRILRIKVSKRT